MAQMALWTSEVPKTNRVVNVSQIPQRSPFRYPGKIISLTVAFENFADHFLMAELDNDVAALWQTILSDDNEWLAERILSNHE